MLCERMAVWIVAAGLVSVAITALLTLVLWRMNAPLRERDDDGASYVAPIIIAGGVDEHHAPDGTSDGGSDGGGGGGGGK